MPRMFFRTGRALKIDTWDKSKPTTQVKRKIVPVHSQESEANSESITYHGNKAKIRNNVYQWKPKIDPSYGVSSKS